MDECRSHSGASDSQIAVPYSCALSASRVTSYVTLECPLGKEDGCSSKIREPEDEWLAC